MLVSSPRARASSHRKTSSSITVFDGHDRLSPKVSAPGKPLSDFADLVAKDSNSILMDSNGIRKPTAGARVGGLLDHQGVAIGRRRV